MEPWERNGIESAKKPKNSPAPAVDVLGDDLLGEIFLRLPDMASLASAALVRKSWGRVASLPAIFRHFLSLRKPPLAGFILTDHGRVPYHCPDLLFISAGSGNPNLTTAVSEGDFFFEDLPDIDSDDEEYYEDEWRLRGCDGGRLLLSRGRDSVDLAVYDPLARTAVFFRAPHAWRLWFHMVRYAIVASETDSSFRVIGLQPWGWGVASSAVFCSSNRKWIMIDSPDADRVVRKFCRIRGDGMPAGRFVYWRSDAKKVKHRKNEEKTLVFDTKTMAWSVINPPFPCGESYCIADMAEHGGLCIVSSTEQCIQLWVRNSNNQWMLKKKVSLLNQFEHLKKLRRDEWMKRVRILAMKAGYVYMEFWSIRKPHSYLLVLNLNTIKLELFCNKSTQPYRGSAFPFFMRFEPLPAPVVDKKL
ncbi:hypothetical protein ACQ4PT_000681 [Festuca glaucescens]